MNSEILQEQQNQIEMLKRENCEMQLRCTKLETDQRQLRNKLSKIENELLESTAIIHSIHEDRWEEGSTRYNMVVDVLAYTMFGSNHHEQMSVARKILIKKTSRVGKYNPYKGRPILVTFVSNEDCEHLLANKNYLPKECLWTNSTVLKLKTQEEYWDQWSGKQEEVTTKGDAEWRETK